MARPGVQLAILLLAIPAQYLISEFMTPSTSDRSFMVKRLASSIQTTFGNTFSIEKWKSLALQIIKINLTPYGKRLEPNGECAAIEVLKAQSPQGHFGMSTKVRSPRPKKIKHRVGQVIKHKLFGYHGVIIGWDETTQAPDSWIQANHQNNPEWKQQPNYAVLVHNDDRPHQISYVVEDNVEVIVNFEVVHYDIDDYFERFDGAQYLLRAWLRELYPED